MKRILSALLVMCMALALLSLSFAADMKRGTIKGIDAEKRTIIFCPAGTQDNITMSVGKTVNLEKFKKEMKVKVYVVEEDGKQTVKGMKPDKRRVIEGC